MKNPFGNFLKLNQKMKILLIIGTVFVYYYAHTLRYEEGPILGPIFVFIACWIFIFSILWIFSKIKKIFLLMHSKKIK